MADLRELQTRIAYEVPEGAMLCCPVPERGRYVVISAMERDLFVRLADEERQRIIAAVRERPVKGHEK